MGDKSFFLPLDSDSPVGEGVDLSFLGDNNTPVESEGQLAVDVLQTKEELIIISALSGTRPDDIELHLHSDLLTIRGVRRSPSPSETQEYLQECFWGKFSRSIVLPVEVKAELAQAEYRYGVLMIKLPKKQTDNEIPIVVVEE